MMKALFSLLLCLLLPSCGEKVVELGAGYRYVQLDGSSFAISDSENRMIVDPNVTKYKVFGAYIVGERSGAKIDTRLSSGFGYFILEMKSGRLVEGLDKSSFEAALRARNLNTDLL